GPGARPPSPAWSMSAWYAGNHANAPTGPVRVGTGSGQVASPVVADDGVERRGEQRADVEIGPAFFENGAEPFSRFRRVVIQEAVRDLKPTVVRRRVRGFGPDAAGPPRSAHTWNLGEIGRRRLTALEEQIHAGCGPPRQHITTHLDTGRGNRSAQ